jgi:hypothetical protein
MFLLMTFIFWEENTWGKIIEALLVVSKEVSPEGNAEKPKYTYVPFSRAV